MIQYLNLQNIGPVPQMELHFGERLNIVTGDNGLGKSFLLDIIWWALTRSWPSEINKGLLGGEIVRPRINSDLKHKSPQIEFEYVGKNTGKYSRKSTWLTMEEEWSWQPGRPVNPGLVLYAMADGSFAVWDPIRNYWKGKSSEKSPLAYVFTHQKYGQD